MKKQAPKVININRAGARFEPGRYTVPFKGNEEIYGVLLKAAPGARLEKRPVRRA